MKKIRYLTDAGLVSAILAIFLLFSRLTGGLLEESFAFILPIPIALYTIKYDWKKGLLPMVAASLLAFLIIDPIRAACFIIPANVIGVIYGAVATKNIHGGFKLAIVGAGSFVINMLTTVIFSKVIFGYSIIDDTKAFVAQIMDMLSFLNLNDNFKSLLEALMIGLIPSIVLTTSILEALLTHTFTAILANRIYKLKVGDVVSNFHFSIPRVVTYFVLPLIAIAIIFLPMYLGLEGALKTLFVIDINISFIFCILYLIQGIMFVSFYSVAKKKPFLPLISFFLVIFFPPILILLGIIDSLFSLKMKVILTSNIR